jgi:transposase
MVTRVAEEAEASVDRLAGLRRIGIDEIAHRRAHRYLTVVVGHDSGRLVWAAPATTKPRCTASSTRSASSAQPGQRRCRRLDRQRDRGALPPGSAVPGPLPRRPLGHRRP